MPEYNEAEIYFQQLLIETKLNILKTLRNNCGKTDQDIFLNQLHELISKNAKLRNMAKECYEDAWFFVFGALIQLMSEGVIGFDEAGKYYFLNSNVD